MKVGIIGAMDVEVELLKKHVREGGELEHIQLGTLEFSAGRLGEHEVIISQCKVGMVNAAVAAQVLTGHFGVDTVVNTGVAGSLDATIDIGDIVVAKDAVNHVMDVCNLGYKPGQPPGFDRVEFTCGEQLQQAAFDAAKELGVTAHSGRVASGDVFVREAADKEHIRSVFDASCCEMEGAAIAQVCWTNKVPFVIVRAISDKADGTDHIDYPTFEEKAARDCAELVVSMLAKLAA